MNVPSLPPAVNRRLSRANSTTSSVATVKHIGSRIGHRKTASQASSDSINRHFSSLDAAAEESVSDMARESARSPNRNINRWSHSTSSSVGGVDAEFLRQVSANASSSRPTRAELPAKPQMIPNPQYSRAPNDLTTSTVGPSRSPGRQSRIAPGGNSPDRSRTMIPVQATRQPPSGPALTSEVDPLPVRSGPSDFFGTTIVDHSRGANKYGQQVEGIAVQFTPGYPRQRRPDQNKLGSTLHQATNSSHISLQKKPVHNRRKDRSENGSNDSTAADSSSATRNDHAKKSSHRSAAQKNMLSQALSKANQAVQLDNAQNIQGAIAAYHEACDILEQVMLRSNDLEDRQKLSNIRGTYSTRIAELYDIDKSFEFLNVDKDLPEAPPHAGYPDGHDHLNFEDPDDSEPSTEHTPYQLTQIPPRQESLLPQIFGGDTYIEQQPPATRLKPPPSNNLNVPMDAKYMPPPLSPRRPASPPQADDEITPIAALPPHASRFESPSNRSSAGPTSWLDTAGENTSSAASSRRSSGIDKTDNALMSAIEANLDNLDAAIDAAYDDDFLDEPTPRPLELDEDSDQPDRYPHSQPSQEGIHSLATQSSMDSVRSQPRLDPLTGEELDDDAEEEEEMLEMMAAAGMISDCPNQAPEAIPSLPRQSDSSGFSVRSSGRTWESSMTAATQGTTLSTLAETPETPQSEHPGTSNDGKEVVATTQDSDPLARKQASPLPPLPAAEKPTAVGLRDRRMSNQGSNQLKIETYSRNGSVSQQGHPAQPPLLEVSSAQGQHPELARSASATNMSAHTLPATPLASVHSMDSMTESPGTPALTSFLSNSTLGEEAFASAQTDAHRMPPHLRKNTSSSNLRPRELSLTTTDLGGVPATPGNALYPAHSRQATALSTPLVSSTSPSIFTSSAVGGMYIFDNIADPLSPRSPRSPEMARAEPMPLEPCPESYLLRPFWLMRCLYQTLAHPRGGYISNKLFIPRDIWRVKGVKLKAMDDKIGQCDMLTAALLKLAKVDTLDADAVLEELQSFDAIIDNARQALSKKLGSDVGLSGTISSIKGSQADDLDAAASKASSSMKSLTSSWRKLRSKSSAAALAPAPMSRKESSTDVGMVSLPMTSNSSVATSRSYRAQKHPPPSPAEMPHIAPQHTSYMSSLARLFDAVQVLDSIARQVEDPGLKATSKTQVGLELSIRGAAEFFSFYIIRFALADITLLIDKYLKRSGEWVMV